MAAAVAKRQEIPLKNDNAPPSREEVLARYRHLRAISVHHNSRSLRLVSVDAMLQQARRLGLAKGRALILEDEDELNYVYDLLLHTAPKGHSRVIDRYARSAGCLSGSDEALVLDAMCTARFAILEVERRHQVAGVIARDVYRGAEVWVVDIGLEASLRKGDIIATRLFTPERFSIAAGVHVPFDLDLVASIAALLPTRLAHGNRDKVINDRRFAEIIYRTALAAGVVDQISYLPVAEGWQPSRPRIGMLKTGSGGCPSSSRS